MAIGNSILILLIVACTISLTMAQAPQNPPMEAIDKFIDAQMRKHQIPGLSLAVVKDGELLLTKGYGLADIELNVAATPETVFQIQSITKSFTATAIMMLVKEKQISLDDEASKYFDGLSPTWKGITPRRLLNHTSGIKDYINEPFASLRIDIADEEVLKQTAARPLNFNPGERYAYCNTGYLLLGMIIKKTTGEPYGDFLRKRIFEPLGMKDTRIVSLKDIIPKRASGYIVQDKKLIRGEYVAQSILSYPGGGILSTVLDVAKYDAIWLRGQLLDESAIKEMWTPGTLNDGSRTLYGFGWGINDLRGHRLITHSGGHMTGFSSRYAVLPQQHMSIVVLTNRSECDTNIIVQGVAGLIDEQLKPPWMMKEQAETDPKRSQKIVSEVPAAIESDKAPWVRALNEEQRTLLKSGLLTTEMKFLASDDVGGKEISIYGIPATQLRYYKMQTADKLRYFKFYLTKDSQLAALIWWDD